MHLSENDAIHSKDVLIHLPTHLALAALKNFERSGAALLLSVSFPKAPRSANKYVPRRHGDGAYKTVQYNPHDERIGFTPINLEAPPFCLPPPLARWHNTNEHVALGRFNGLWRLPALNRSKSPECVGR